MSHAEEVDPVDDRYEQWLAAAWLRPRRIHVGQCVTYVDEDGKAHTGRVEDVSPSPWAEQPGDQWQIDFTDQFGEMLWDVPDDLLEVESGGELLLFGALREVAVMAA